MKILFLSTVMFFYTVITVKQNDSDDCNYTMTVEYDNTMDTIKFNEKCIWVAGDTFSMPGNINLDNY